LESAKFLTKRAQRGRPARSLYQLRWRRCQPIGVAMRLIIEATRRVRLVVASPEFTFNGNWGAASEWKMKRYTAEFKEWAMRQMMPPLNRMALTLAGSSRKSVMKNRPFFRFEAACK
jgi:hypothetical protein